MTKDYVIIGNGIAGLSAAEEIRKNDSDGNIKIITDEKYLTYYRIKLSEAISKDFSEKQLFVRDKAWYDDLNIEILSNTKVIRIDTSNKELYTQDKKINYDKLLIASGSRSFIPPIEGSEKKGVFALRSLEDLSKIKEYFKTSKRIAVLGGGLLGLEAAWAIKKLGKQVDVVEFFPQLLPRQLDEKIAGKFSEILSEKGINLHLGVTAKEIKGDERASSIELSNGTNLETDAILISAGVRPRLELVKETDIEHDKGIKIDKYMKTNIENVFAAGDVAEIDGIVAGLWTIANDQGKIAGKNMTGEKEEYKLPRLTTILNIADCSIFSIGDIEKYDSTHEEDNENTDASYKLCVTEGKITGGIIFNDIGKSPKVKKAIEEKIDISEFLKKDMSITEIIENI